MFIYAIDCTPWLSEEALSDTLPYLDDKRLIRIRRLRIPLKKAQCAAAGRLLTHILGKDNKAPAIRYGENGKPYLADDPETHFNITHSGKWLFLAVADCEIGIDAQVPKKVCPRLASRSTTPDELLWVNQNTEAHFSRLWTMKEAYLKFTGKGITIPIRQVSIPTPPADGFDATNNCYWLLRTYEGIPLSVCSAKPMDHIPITTIKSLP